jgi:hypothetical protein
LVAFTFHPTGAVGFGDPRDALTLGEVPIADDADSAGEDAGEDAGEGVGDGWVVTPPPHPTSATPIKAIHATPTTERTTKP